jgi:CO/xanthine dehydrogenase FAD-binding subunit
MGVLNIAIHRGPPEVRRRVLVVEIKKEFTLYSSKQTRRVKKTRWSALPTKVSKAGHDREGAQQFEQDRIAAGHKRMTLDGLAN